MKREKKEASEGKEWKKEGKLGLILDFLFFQKKKKHLYSLSQITPGENKAFSFIPIAVKNALAKSNKGGERAYLSCDFKLQPILGGWQVASHIISRVKSKEKKYTLAGLNACLLSASVVPTYTVQDTLPGK